MNIDIIDIGQQYGSFTGFQIQVILDRYGNGEPLKEIFRSDLSLPYRVKEFINIMQQEQHIELWKEYRQAHSHALVDEIVYIADNTRDSGKAKNMISARQWAASRFNQEDYGDKSTVNHIGKIDVRAAIIAARERAGKNALIDITPDIAKIATAGQSVVVESNDDTGTDIFS